MSLLTSPWKTRCIAKDTTSMTSKSVCELQFLALEQVDYSLVQSDFHLNATKSTIKHRINTEKDIQYTTKLKTCDPFPQVPQPEDEVHGV